MLLVSRMSRNVENEQGTALLAALGLTAVAAVIAIVVTTTSLFSVGFTTATQAAVQSQAAAEAGIDFAAASVSSTTTACQASYSNSSAPLFTVTVSYSTLSPVPSPLPDTGMTWVSGCPTLGATLVKFVSTGTASSPGLVGNAGGNTRRVEAIFPFRPNAPGTGATLYSFSQTDSTGTNFTLTQGSTTATPSIQYLTAPGGLVCTSANNTINGNLVVGSGSVTIGTQCQINGDLSAGGVITVKGTVTGNVTSASSSSPAISVTGQVNGSIYAGGPVSIGGPIGGNVVAGPGGGTTTISATVGGSVVAAGAVSPPVTTLVTGTITQNKTGMVAPTAPFVPGWVDYPWSTYSLTAFQNLGYTENILPAASCTSAAAVNTELSRELALPTPQIFNALACGAAGPNFGNLPSTVTLTNNLVIVASSLAFPNSGNSFVSSVSTSSSPHRKLWLIIPDMNLTGVGTPPLPQPDCPGPQTISVGKLTVSASGNVDAMIYSPCYIANSPNSWQGQIYASGLKMSNGFQINYVPLGLPGYDLSNGGGNSGPAPGVLGTRTSIRNIS